MSPKQLPENKFIIHTMRVKVDVCVATFCEVPSVYE